MAANREMEARNCMATIVVTSDLHLGITSPEALRQLRDAIAAAQPELTILAGDQGEPLDYFVACLQIFADLPGAAAVLAGNHDVWARDGHTSRDLWEHELPAATRTAGMLWLEDTSWRSGDLAVAGSLAWYDYSAVDPGAPNPAGDFMTLKRLLNNDARFIDWSWSDPEFALQLGDGLARRLGALEADPDVRDVFVVTHVPICEEQMLRKPHDLQWGLSNAFFGNMTTGRRALAWGKVRAIVSGHTHLRRMGTVTRAGLSPVATAVIPSDYGTPAALAVDTTTWEIREIR